MSKKLKQLVFCFTVFIVCCNFCCGNDDINLSISQNPPESNIINENIDTTNSMLEDELFSAMDFENSLDTTIKLEARIDVPLELSLEKALNTAITQNLDLIFAKSQTTVEKWKLWDNVSNWLPDYKAGFIGQRLDGNFLVGGVFPIMTLTSSFNAFMRFDYRFFEGGSGVFNTLAQKKIYNASKQDLASTLNNLLLDVSHSYNQLLREQAQLNVYAKSIEEANAQVKLNENLEKQGVGTKFDVLQSEAQLAEQEQEYIVQQTRLREASIELAKLLNIDQGVIIKPDNSDLKIKDISNLNKPILDLISLAKENRPEAKSLKLRYLAQRNHIGTAFSSYLPRANFFGQYGGTGNAIFHRSKVKGFIPDAIALDDTGNPVISMVSKNQVSLNDTSNVSNIIRGGGSPSIIKLDDSLMASKSLGVQLDWDIGDGLGLTTLSKINQARNITKAAKTSFDILNQKVEQEVRITFLKLQAAQKLLSVSEKRISAATEALRLAKLRLENGVGINTELLNAQKQYISALASKVDAIIAYNNSRAEFLHGLGLINIKELVRDF